MDTKDVAALFFESMAYRFAALKDLGDKALAQLEDADLYWAPGEESNSIAVIIQHLHGNMLSRWTDFLTSDGNKPWRDRDGEFDPTKNFSRDELMRRWDEGWACLTNAIQALGPEDLTKEVTIRGQALGVIDAIERQLSHYAYHVGQLVFLARMRRGAQWQTLSISRGASQSYTPTKRD